MNTRLSVGTLAAALCSAAGMAMAQDTGCCSKGESEEIVIEGVRLDQPTTGVWRTFGDGHWSAFGDGQTVVVQPEKKTTSRTVMVQRDGDHEYKVEIDGEKVQAWIDGERVPRKRVKVTDNQISLTGEDGETVVEFPRAAQIQMHGGLPFPGRSVTVFGDEGEGPLVWRNADNTMAFAQPERDPPPVMIGINMGPLEEVDEAVQNVLDDRELSTEDVIVVVGVVEGLPAAEAGVADGDVIVRLDGDWGANPEKLREILMSKEPGDSLEVLVLRDGKRKEIAIELAEYDGSRLGQSVAPMVGVAPSGVHPGDNEEIQALIERLHEHGEGMDEDLHKDIEALIERLHKQDFNQFRQLDEMPRFRFDLDTNRAPRALVVPRTPGVPAAPSPNAMREYQDRFDRLEQRLDRLEQRIDRLINALESRERDGN